ncbi:site-2 protease family protein [Aquariibacter albus]|uniref:site-2 protease family protein n=1 Tax=Aquariibacter albus TaxID=2759899 RepID=UPI001F205809|nr:site-2 protease family protein [Aquariibacter albus]
MEAPELVRTLAVYLLPVLFAITLHEVAHGHAAWRLGDPTAAVLGRLSLNPLRHIDPIGTVLMPLLLYAGTGGAFVFGYAKPVPVDMRRLRHPKRDMVWVAFAGPAANLVQALLWAVLGTGLIVLGVEEPFFRLVCKAGVLVNLVMFAFNLLPLPPLDGGRIAVGLLPLPLARPLARVERWGFFLVVGLVLIGVVTPYWMLPIMRFVLKLMRELLPALNTLLATLPSA